MDNQVTCETFFNTHIPGNLKVFFSFFVLFFFKVSILEIEWVRVRAIARVIVLCSWARHFTLTVSLCTQVHKWVSANLMPGGMCVAL